MSMLKDNGTIATWMNRLFFYDDGNVILGWRDYVVSGEVERVIYQPHKDWNQLMEVVEKIEGKCLVYIGGCSCRICTMPYDINFEATTKIQAVYQAVLEYIKQQKEVGNGQKV